MAGSKPFMCKIGIFTWVLLKAIHCMGNGRDTNIHIETRLQKGRVESYKASFLHLFCGFS